MSYSSKRWLAGLTCIAMLVLLLGSVHAGGDPAATDWTIFGATSEVRIPNEGEDSFKEDQVVGVGAAIPTNDWRTLESVQIPEVSLGFDLGYAVEQTDEAQGGFVSVGGAMTLSIPVRLTDADDRSVSFTVEMTTGTSSELDPETGLLVSETGSDRDDITGAVTLVSVTPIPDGTAFNSRLLVLVMDGEIAVGNSDGDTLENFVDNCPVDDNETQVDEDLDGIGDACDDCTDLDRDGAGNGDAGNASCPLGTATDCNDGDPTIFPGAPEYCDGIDNDCGDGADEAVCADFDANGDGRIDGTELSRIGRAFGLCSSGVEWWTPIDYYPDGCIDGEDLHVLMFAWDCDEGPLCD